MSGTSEKGGELPQSTKLRILDAAEEVFAARGFEGASTREIAGRAGVNISSLHYHWESKETLYVGVLERIYERLVGRVRDDFVVPESKESARAVIARAVGRTFDFYADNPNVPKLLMRRIMDGNGTTGAAERDVMGPVWKTFAGWTHEFTGGRLAERDVTFHMLTVQSVLLVVMLDSPHVAAMLGGTVRDTEVRSRLREQVVDLVVTLVGVG